MFQFLFLATCLASFVHTHTLLPTLGPMCDDTTIAVLREFRFDAAAELHYVINFIQSSWLCCKLEIGRNGEASIDKHCVASRFVSHRAPCLFRYNSLQSHSVYPWRENSKSSSLPVSLGCDIQIVD